jgi:hypothetical protein
MLIDLIFMPDIPLLLSGVKAGLGLKPNILASI